MQKQVFKQEDWNLKDLLKTHKGKEFDNYLKQIEKDVEKFESLKKELNENISSKKLSDIIKFLEKIECDSSKVEAYYKLWFSVETKSQEARAFKDRMEKYLTELGNKMLFFSLWFKALDDKNAERLIKSAEQYSYFLEKLRLTKDFTLTENEEKIINIKDVTGNRALLSLYTMVTSSFKFEFKINNEIKTLNESQLSSYAYNPDPKLRAQAYQVMFKNYEKNKDVLGEIYKNVISNYINEYVKLRKYKSSISRRNLGNNISDKAVETMLNVCKKNIKIFQRFFKLKAKLLNVKKLNRYDISAPLSDSEENYSYNDAVNLVINCYTSFSPELANLALKIINEKHIHSKLSDSKRGGAYCLDAMPGITPYVFLNYDGKAKDVITLAHELGHGVHGLLAHSNTALTYYPPLILAETASIFGEMIVTDKLLTEEKNNKEKQALIESKIKDMYGSIIRQAYFTLFELEAHKAIENGVTVDGLSEMWLNNLKEQFGDSVEVPEEFKYEWLRVPHIYESPFYCYAYSLGNLLVLALYQMYKTEGKSFVPKYLKFLSYGGSKKPEEICKELGIDLSSEKFWQKGFDVINEMIDEFENVTKKN